MSKTATVIKPKNHYVQYAYCFDISPEEEKLCADIAVSDGVSCSSHISGDPKLAMAFFDHLWPYAFPRYHRIPLVTKLVRTLAKEGIIHTGSLFEKAISKKGKLKRDPVAGRDFVDLSDAKTTSVRLHGKTYSAYVNDLRAKQGAIRILCYERVLNKFYYFIVPAYANPKTCIEIPFDLAGRPSRNNKWWAYEVLTFADVCA